MTDHWPRAIPHYRKSCALLSESNVTTAVVFVHGFNGNPSGTFSDFQGLIHLHPPTLKWWAGTDLYFFSYRSVTDNITTSSERFREFLTWVFPSPPRELFLLEQEQYPWLDLRVRQIGQWPRNYEKLVLVGHSEGAVVIRRTICDIARTYTDAQLTTTPNPIFSASLRLFAPATSGAKPKGLWSLLLNLPGLGLPGRAFLEWSRAASDLTNQSSTSLLADLKDEVHKYEEKYKNLRAFRAKTVFGTKESVVIVNKWRCDDNEVSLKGHSHTSICKPQKKTSYFYPLDFVT